MTEQLLHHDVKRLLARRERELEAARRISNALSRRLRLDELIEQALKTALDVVDAENGSLLLANAETQQLVFHYSCGTKPVAPGTAIPWSQGIAGAVFQSGQVEIVADVKKDSRHCDIVDAKTGFSTRDMITLPLVKWEGEPIGVIQVMNKRDGQLCEDDAAILSIISALSASAIEQTRLFEAAKLAEVAMLMGDVSHDIKNLLMPIVCGAGLLRDEINDLLPRIPDVDKEQAQASRNMCNEVIVMLTEDAQRIQDRVKEIADAVKGLSAKPEFQPCLVHEVIGQVFKTLNFVAQEKQVQLQTDRLDLLPTIVADHRRLYNAFYNLVNNAIPETPPGGSVTIRRHPEEHGSIHVSVVDTGRGMPREVSELLFTAKARSTKPGGTGLGTKIVKDVITSHGGKIWVESSLGHGSAFHITLPINQMRTF
jgi:signal transduction histidine kinase